MNKLRWYSFDVAHGELEHGGMLTGSSVLGFTEDFMMGVRFGNASVEVSYDRGIEKDKGQDVS